MGAMSKSETVQKEVAIIREENHFLKEKLRATLISLFENQLKAKEGMIKSNERIMKLMKEASFLKKELRIKEKGLMRGLDPSNIKDTKRKRQDKFCKFKIENNIS